MQKALKLINEPLFWTDVKTGKQKADPALLGDVVLARKDFPTSYHLSVVVDDHIQQIFTRNQRRRFILCQPFPKGIAAFTRAKHRHL